MSWEIKKLEEELRALENKQKIIIDKAISEDRDMTDPESKEFDGLETDVGKTRSKLDLLKRKESIEQSQAEQVEKDAEKKEMTKEEFLTKVSNGFRNYFRTGRADPKFQEFLMGTYGADYRAAQQSTTVGAGGYTIPQGFQAELAKAELEFGGMQEVSRIIRTNSGNDLPWPATNDTGNKAYQVSEAGNLETSATAVTFTQPITLKAYKWTSGLIRLSRELIEDSAFSMMDILRDLIAERMARGLNTAYTTGTGSSTIEGVVTGATSSAVTPAATTFTRANMLDLMHTVDPRYRLNGRWMFDDGTLKIIKKMTVGTADDRPLWVPSPRDGAPSTIEGKPYTINQDVAAVAASAKSMLFGDFMNYIIRIVNGDRLVVLNERFADTDEIGIVLLRRVDGHVLDAGTHPIKYWTHASS